MAIYQKNNLLIDIGGGLESNIWDVYRNFNAMLDVQYNKEASIITISIAWTDPEKAALWVNALIWEFNEYIRTREIERSQKNLKYLNEELARTRVEDFRLSLYELIAQEQKKAMLANTQNEFVFRVLDKAEAPDMKVYPRRARIVVISTFVALIFSLLVVFIREIIIKEKEKLIP